MKPINDNLIVAPSVARNRGLIQVPDDWLSGASTSCMALAVGEKVNPVIKPGDIVMCQVGFVGRNENKVGKSDAFWCKEENLYAIIKNKVIFPLGRRILIKRDVLETESHGIVLPATRRSQSLTGQVLRFGFTREMFKYKSLQLGDYIRLAEWNESMIQIDLEDGSHGMIVNEQDILYTYEKNQGNIQH